MWEDTYCVTIDGKAEAKGLTLKTATILIKAIFEEYYLDTEMVVSIKKEKVEQELDSENK